LEDFAIFAEQQVEGKAKEKIRTDNGDGSEAEREVGAAKKQ